MEPYVVQPPADRTAEREAAARVFLFALDFGHDGLGDPAPPAPAPAAQHAPVPGLAPQQQQQQQAAAAARAGEADGVRQGFALPQAARAAPASTAAASSVSSSSRPASSASFSSSSFAPPPPPQPAPLGAAQPGRNDEVASACEATAAAPEFVPLPPPAEPTAPPPKRGFEEGPVPAWSARRPSHTRGAVHRARPWPRLQPLAVHRAGRAGAATQALPLERIKARAA